jgi:hypothetical protein
VKFAKRDFVPLACKDARFASPERQHREWRALRDLAQLRGFAHFSQVFPLILLD